MIPLVTIAIPTLNRPKFLELTLKSVTTQTYKNIEIIVSDNGSKRHINDFVLEYAEKDKRIRYRRNLETISPAGHFNQCLNMANGEYFMIISDDDLISEDFIERMVFAFLNNKEVVIGISRCQLIDRYGNFINTLIIEHPYKVSGLEFLLNWLWFIKPLPVTTFISMFMKTEKVRNVGGFPEFTSGSNSENHLLLCLLLQGDIVFDKTAIFYYRYYPESYGLNTSYKDLARSSYEWRCLIKIDENITKRLNSLPAKCKKKIIKGISYLLAYQYFGRLKSVYFPKIHPFFYPHAIFCYKIDLEYIKLLINSFFSLILNIFNLKKLRAYLI